MGKSKQLSGLENAMEKFIRSKDTKKTRDTYAGCLEHFAGFYIQNFADKSVIPDVEQVIPEYQKHLRDLEAWADIAPATRRLRLVVLQGFLKDMAERNQFKENVTSDTIERLINYPNQRYTITQKEKLTRTEIQEMNLSSQTPRQFALLTFLPHSGLRVSEVVRLTPNDFFKRGGPPEGVGFVTVRKSKQGKTRDVPIKNDAWMALELYLNEQNRSLDDNDEHPIFLSSQPGEVHPETINNDIKRVQKRTSIDRTVTCHTFRHSYATISLEQGISIYKVSDRLGHSELTTTVRYYRDGKQAQRAENIDLPSFGL
jgi:integrase/recombinase XerD